MDGEEKTLLGYYFYNFLIILLNLDYKVYYYLIELKKWIKLVGYFGQVKKQILLFTFCNESTSMNDLVENF